ncbi:MAG: hypothetical protein GX022_05210 [Clostridiaceae bacterium]|nr:hypothetical protein [Clostridiaceae bacterium]
MSENGKKLDFRLGEFGRFIPVIIAIIFIVIAGINQSNVNGYVIAFFVAVIASVPFAKKQQEYGEAVVTGLTRPIFCIISVAVILASIAGKLVSSAGLIHTLAAFVIKAKFTGGLFAATSFVICCILSMSTGTSVGTNIISFPILFPVGVMAGVHPGFMAGALVSGALFGDNLAPISDTTIASAGSQHADMGGVVRTRVWYSVPVAIAVFFVELLFAGRGGQIAGEAGADLTPNPLSLVMLIAPIVIMILCFMRKHLIVALSYGVLSGIIVGLASGLFKFSDIFSYPGGFKVGGIFIDAITGSAGTVMMLYGVFALLGIMEKSGLVDLVGEKLAKVARGVRGTEVSIVLSVGIMAWITGVIAVGMVALGDTIIKIGERVGINKYRRANLMDCGGIALAALVPWTVHTVLPAQLAASSVEGVSISPTNVLTHNFYSIIMLIMLIIMIVTGYGRNNNPELSSNAEKAASEE